jgi:hypothetical protein
MTATKKRYDLGQSLWLDNVIRDLLTGGTLKRYIEQLSVTSLTSNLSIFDQAIAHSNACDAEIRRLAGLCTSGNALFFEPAIEDLRQAADLFAPAHQRAAGADGWVSLEASPLLAHDANQTVAKAKALQKKANRRNLFIKIPTTNRAQPDAQPGHGGVERQPADAVRQRRPAQSGRLKSLELWAPYLSLVVGQEAARSYTVDRHVGPASVGQRSRRDPSSTSGLGAGRAGDSER